MKERGETAHGCMRRREEGGWRVEGGEGAQRVGRVCRGWAGNGRGKAGALKTKLKLRWAG